MAYCIEKSLGCELISPDIEATVSRDNHVKAMSCDTKPWCYQISCTVYRSASYLAWLQVTRKTKGLRETPRGEDLVLVQVPSEDFRYITQVHSTHHWVRISDASCLIVAYRSYHENLLGRYTWQGCMDYTTHERPEIDAAASEST